MNGKSVLIIYTGGTIGMMKDPETDLLKPFDFEQITNQVPELNRFAYKIDSILSSALSKRGIRVWPVFLISTNSSLFNSKSLSNKYTTEAGVITSRAVLVENVNAPFAILSSSASIVE